MKCVVPHSGQRSASRLLLSSFVFAFLAASGAHTAHAQLNNSQLHLRTGYFSSNFNGSGVEGKPYTDIMTINVELEQFQSSRMSHAFRTIVAMDFASAKLMYFNAGYGQRYYLGGSGMNFKREENNITIVSVPKLRYFVGFNAGLSQVIVKSLSPALQIVSSCLDLGLDSGLNYALGTNTALSVSTGASFGWGFSSVAVTGITMHLLVGANYSY